LAQHSGFSRLEVVCCAFSIIGVMELHKWISHISSFQL
jgi:hypothetical protein